MKRIICVFLAIIMLFSITIYAFSTPPSSAEKTKLITVKECQIAGQKWITANYEAGTVISSIYPVKDLYDNINGYCINFAKDGQSKGYLILNADVNSTSFIREFTLDGPGVYEYLLESSKLSTTADVAIYSTDPFQYGIKYYEEGIAKIYNCDSKTLSLDVAKVEYPFSSSAYKTQAAETRTSDEHESIYDAFFYGYELTGYTAANDKIISGASGFVPEIMSTYVSGSNEGNCAPTAALNLMSLYDHMGTTDILMDDDLDTTYLALANAMGFDFNGDEGVTFAECQWAINYYVTGQSYICTIDDYAYDEWFYFKRDLDANKTLLLSIGGWVQENDVWSQTGHAMIGIGYRILNDGNKYIRVCDGWKLTSARFVQFDPTLLTRFNGASVVIN